MTEVSEKPRDVRLYVLVRNDLASLNPGKAAAQATHAANQCVYELRKRIRERIDRRQYPILSSDEHHMSSLLNSWEEYRGFGTCIVLAAPIDEIYKIVQQTKQNGYHSNITHDPSYPLRDGTITHLIPLDTCAYIFGLKEQLEPFLCHLSLM